MTTLELALHTAQAGEPLKNKYSRSAPISPSAASSVSDSVFSNGDARSSQSSAPSSVKGSPLTYESSDSDVSDALSTTDSVSEQLGQDFSQASLTNDATTSTVAVQRRHPRRTAAKGDRSSLQHESAKPVPSLVRQCDRKGQFVEALVDTATEMIEVIWPLSKASCSLPQGGRNVLDLRKFVQEVLRRSKTSHSTLQVALFYLMLLIPFVPKPEVPERASDPAQCRALRCGRRMFLAALILASKYLQDRNYTMSAWAKISGLKKEEICYNELAFLKTVNFDLHVPESKYKVWTELVFKCSVDDDCRMARTLNGGRCEKWRAIIPSLTADLSIINNSEVEVSKPASPVASSAWSPPAPSFCAPSSERSDSPASTGALPFPPPQFLEPKVTTPADRVRFPTSPRLSKLETPCLPPINFDCTPAASRSQTSRCAAMGMALKQASNMLPNRLSGDMRPCSLVPRVKTKLCRRSALSQCSSTSGESDYQDESMSLTPCAARESHLRAFPAAIDGTRSDQAATCAAQSLLNLKSFESSAYSTPESMRSLSNGSSFSSEDELRTPKAEDLENRPVARTVLKRSRPSSKCESETDTPAFGPTIVSSPHSMPLDYDVPAVPTGMVKHRGGALVDYSAGIDDISVRSRASHMRSASGSRNGSRKKTCSSLAKCLRA